MTSPTPILDAWKFFMKDVPTPATYVEMSFYAMISACLQRRVYMHSEAWPVFPNQYIMLVGEPAVGKGLAIKPVNLILRAMVKHKLGSVSKEEATKHISEEQYKALMLWTEQAMASNNARLQGKDALTRQREALIIPIAPKSLTLPQLIKLHTESLDAITPPNPTPICKDGIYMHSSLAVINDEIATMFSEKKETKDLITYLTDGWDCNDYDKETKDSGCFYIKNSCLNMLGGTQPSFMKKMFKDELMNEGFASRCILVVEEEPPFVKWEWPVTEEQKEAFLYVSQHVVKLTKLFGNVKLTPECNAFMKNQVEEIWPRNIVNPSPRLKFYRGRKAQHFRKLTMAMHFGENTSMEIEHMVPIRAAAKLDSLERKMDMATSAEGMNPYIDLYDKVCRYAEIKKGVTDTEIWMEFVNDIPTRKELDDVITFLVTSGRLKVEHNMLMKGTK